MKRKKMDWKTKFFLSTLSIVLLVIVFIFSIGYSYFANKLTGANEQIVLLTFQESETGVKNILNIAERCLSKLSFRSVVWDFSEEEYESVQDRSVTIRDIVQYMNNQISVDESLYGFGIWSGDGRCVVSTGIKSKTGSTEPDADAENLMEACRNNYPFVTWISGSELNLEENDTLYTLTENSVLIGIRALGEADGYLEDSYLLVALSEDEVHANFTQSVYNGSCTVLLDENGVIISSTDESLLGQAYEPSSENQNIEYDLSYNDWRLINMIPKSAYLKEIRDIRNAAVVLCVSAAIALSVFFSVWFRRYTVPIHSLMESMDSVGGGELDIAPPENKGWPELVNLNNTFYQTVLSLKDYIRRLKEAEQEKAQEELRALQYQINPHFLQNSLNSIRWMAVIDGNTKVADSLMNLSRLITPVLRNPSFIWKLRDELEFLDNYVEMMKIRYGNHMEYCVECEVEILEESFPRFILQPLIENCFVHGSSAKEIRGINLTIRKSEHFVVEVQNTGVVLDERALREISDKIYREENDGKNIGLANIRKRLNLLYGDKAKIWIESDAGSGFCVWLSF